MISKQEVKHIAKLARLGLTGKEIEKFQRELSRILDYIEKLKEVDVSKVEPYIHPIKMENIMRKDQAKEKEIEMKKKLIEMAPEKKKGYLKTKSILK
ncbi:MAG: Asp-tRNA(Asn)/Glu-tRNA(Gln) amidotransferase subunit GatC [Patescibacteria group bacterium]|nr:Asp-tRNA(Asn)/Glu-tRNA(Gln) amidotransferase subunit GatC [Patescibacteria group bacterium]